MDDIAYSIHDRNKRLEEDIHQNIANLTYEGSRIIHYSDWYDQIIKYTYQINRVIELAFGDSRNSIGLQVADFFASMTYHYYKKDKPTSCGWWGTLVESLDRQDGDSNGELIGYGLKEFP